MYPSDMTEAQWEVVQKHLPPGKRTGRPRVRSARDMINAIFYVQTTGCQWRALPKDYPPWKQVYNTFARWRKRGVWDALLVALRQQVRTKAGKQATPSVAIMDSQSVKTVSKGGSAATTRARKPRVQAPHSRRHTGTAAGGSGVFGRHPGSGGRQGAFGAPVYALRAFQAHLCRWWLCGQAHRLEPSHVWLDAASDQAPGATRLQGIAQTLDRGENLCLAESLTQAFQGL